jgi:hypothetical protein
MRSVLGHRNLAKEETLPHTKEETEAKTTREGAVETNERVITYLCTKVTRRKSETRNKHAKRGGERKKQTETNSKQQTETRG